MTKCAINSCNFDVYEHPWCAIHFARFKAFGSVLGSRVRDTGTLNERFHKKYIMAEKTGCWLWIGSCQGDGYATIQDGRRNLLATRLSYEIHFGDLQPTDKICHKCDIPSCVNPDHLFLGTDQTNATDKMQKGRNVHVGGKSELTAEDVVYIRQSDLNNKILADQFNLTPKSIKNIKTKKTFSNVLDTGKVLPLDERSYNLNWASVVLLRLSKLTNKQVSQLFKIDESTVSDARLGRSWNSISPVMVEDIKSTLKNIKNGSEYDKHKLKCYCSVLSKDNFQLLINSC